jgi:hypothetical protein
MLYSRGLNLAVTRQLRNLCCILKSRFTSWRHECHTHYLLWDPVLNVVGAWDPIMDYEEHDSTVPVLIQFRR